MRRVIEHIDVGHVASFMLADVLGRVLPTGSHRYNSSYAYMLLRTKRLYQYTTPA